MKTTLLDQDSDGLDNDWFPILTRALWQQWPSSSTEISFGMLQRLQVERMPVNRIPHTALEGGFEAK